MTEAPTLLFTKPINGFDLPGRVPDPLIDQDIKRAIDEQLAQKGPTKLEKDAELYVGYQTVIDLEKGINLSAWGMRGPSGWSGWDSGSVTGQTSTIPVGMLLVDLFDPARKQLGLARGRQQDYRPQKRSE